MDFSVVAVAREDDRPVEEPLRVAALADRLGYREVWAGEGPAWDAFVLAAALGRVTERAVLTAGPVPVSVRDPYSLARGAASVAAVSLFFFFRPRTVSRTESLTWGFAGRGGGLRLI
ncbi:LLM class flavin-dependent oxidoreductase, partial [Streptomyces sp. NPDC050121]|uniref:LLM class flavin-dependent oxidoreductase n=1 Tax=Streptomyces sp. NPDC050121 TaxID=3365601 RepID=UPI00379423CE